MGRDYLSPPGIRYGGAGPAGSVILATPGAARGDGFTCYAAVAGPGYGGLPPGGYLMRAFSPGRISMGAGMILQGIATRCHLGHRHLQRHAALTCAVR